MKFSSILATFVGLCGTALFTVLLCQSIIGAAAYVFLISITALVSLVIHGFSRLKELDLKNLKLTLDKIEAVKRDIYAKEHDLKRAATVFARLILFNSNWQHRLSSNKLSQLRERWMQQRTDELLASLRIPKKDLDDVCWYYEAVKRVDGFDVHDPKRNQEWNAVLKRLEEECEEHDRAFKMPNNIM